ncbi:hypothetical protein J31TS4_06740 [Paenibacillus sp. J31TS4]|uniref:hypothetical protein n=1 Tax=Paenibacillus sp. J31TS4 TaxID=2807195 RepID=UPI001B210F4D|nr:hypothetical protein [Paenibacillus sp. J31TS4]GIP37394.1 hypothetical protein J31TS4_06740 [Paenibacillus sp. J31TS4]
MDQEAKRELVERALKEGLIHDPSWQHRLEEPMPAWAVLELVLHLLERLDPPGIGYD